VNKTFARAYLGETPVGSIFNGREVVGVVEDIKDRGTGNAVDPQIFSLYDADHGAPLVRPSAFFIRTTADFDVIAPMMRSVVKSIDGRLGLDEVATVAARLSAMIAEPRLYATVAGASAAFVVIVAAVGLFGVLWNGVANRTREIGVRSALGATPTRIAQEVLREGFITASIGTAIGLLAAAALVRYLASLLYQVVPYDPIVFTAAPAMLLIVALAASLVPARRAAAIDPVDALRTT
jgi:ABC-type antimicrobial peptide transport system permease subunit